MGIILSHGCWVYPLPPARQVGHPCPQPPPPVTAAKEGGGGLGKWVSVSPPPPPPAEQFSSRPACDLEVVNHHSARALCRFMYTEHGFAIPTSHDGGSDVHYCQVATQLWERLAKRHTGRRGARQAGAISGWPTGPFLWPQAASGPKPLVSNLLLGPRATDARRRNSLLPGAAAPHGCVTITQIRQQRFVQALMQAAHVVARCLTIASQGLREQRNEPLTSTACVQIC